MTRPAHKSSLLRNDAVLSALAALLLVCVVCAAVYRERHPAPPFKDGDPSSFDTARALAHLSHIAAEPHPSNSAAHERVRDYIVGELSKQGLQPEIQTAQGAASVDGQGRPSGAAQPGGAGQVKNIVARLAGSEPDGRALMLAAHYDSVEGSPGASDDGAGVATLLETLRALRAGSPQLRRDVIFLFTDGEEAGLLGAKAFVAEHPLAKRIGLVLNFEARGTCGTVYMFETSERNDALIAGFAKAAPRPYASSLAYTIYKLLPNDTDLTVFKRAGMAGLNFAYLGCAANYHSGSDSVANLDEDSLRHMGSYALPLARHFGDSQLEFSGARPAVYFDLFGFGLVHYPQAWVMPLALGAALLFALVFYYGLRTKQLTVRGAAFGFFGLLFGMVCASIVAAVFTEVSSLAGAREAHSSSDELLALCVIILALLLVAVIYLRLLKRASAASLSAGSLLWWLILTLGLSRDFPGASYVFMWPLLFGLLALALLLAGGASKMHPFALMLTFGVLTFPAVALLARTLDGFVQALGLRMPIVLVALAVLTFGLLVPFLTFMPGTRSRARADGFPETDP